LTDEQEAEVRQLLAELEHRKRVNPLSFYVHLPTQDAFHGYDSKDKNLFGGNRPLSYGTLVKMADGSVKKIEDLVVGDEVLSFDGIKSIPSKIIAIPFNGEIDCYVLTTKSGLEINCSLDHCFPVLYVSNGKKNIAKFSINDLISEKYRQKQFISSGVQEYRNKKTVPFSGLLLGLYLGDGSSSFKSSIKKGKIYKYSNCNFTNSQNKIADLFSEEIKRYFPDLRCNVRKSDLSRIFVSGKLRLHNGFLESLKYLGLAGMKSNKKFIPDCYKCSSVDDRRGILRGLIITDGGTDIYKTTIYSNSLKMLEDAAQIIISLGGRSKIYIDHKPDNENQKTTYKLQFSNEFLYLMGIGDLFHKSSKTRLSRTPRRDDLIVKTITHDGVMMGRCITVDHPSHTFVLANGIVTYNSGKTEEAAEYGLSKGLAKPKQRIWMCSETFSDSVNIMQRKVWKLVPKNQIAYGLYDDINGFTNRKLKLKNGTLFIFKSYDQGVQSFAQDDVDLIVNDEEPPFDIYKEQRMRLIDRNGEMVISMTSTKGVTDLIADIFEDCDIIQTRYSDILKENLPVVAEKNGIRFYMLWTTDNPHIDQDRLLHEIKFMTRDEIKSRIHGIPVNLSGRIYSSFSKNIHVIPFEQAPLTNVQLYHILDPHDRKPWAMKWIILHKTGTAYCIDEYPNRNFNEMISDDKTYDDYADIIREKENALFDIYGRSVYKRIIDPNFGSKTIRLAEKQDNKAHTTPKDELKKRGFKFHDGIDALEAGHLKVREMLHYETKDGEIVVQPKYFITDNCTNSSRHLSRYSRKDIMTADGDVKDKTGVQEKYKDFCDLDRYFWMSDPKYIDGLQEFVASSGKAY
jgi:phage terminase large subunit-like protein